MLRLDITDPESVAAVALAAPDVTLLGTAATDLLPPGTPAMNHPGDVARIALDGVEAGRFEVVVDDCARVKASLAGDPSLFYGLTPA
jgi:hypothetical protein